MNTPVPTDTMLNWITGLGGLVIGAVQCGLIFWGIRAMKGASDKRGDRVEAQESYLERQGTALEKQGVALERQGVVLEKQNDILASVGKALEGQSNALERQGRALEKLLT